MVDKRLAMESAARELGWTRSSKGQARTDMANSHSKMAEQQGFPCLQKALQHAYRKSGWQRMDSRSVSMGRCSSIHGHQ